MPLLRTDLPSSKTIDNLLRYLETGRSVAAVSRGEFPPRLPLLPVYPDLSSALSSPVVYSGSSAGTMFRYP